MRRTSKCGAAGAGREGCHTRERMVATMGNLLRTGVLLRWVHESGVIEASFSLLEKSHKYGKIESLEVW